MVTSAKALVIGSYKGRSEIVEAFQGTEFWVSETVDCLSGLKRIVEEGPSVVVVYQGRSLAQTQQALRAVRCVTSAPVLVVGRGSEQALARALRYNADAYLTRALDPATFLAYVRAVMSKN
jgi:DNA-binding response OmpR family regulator